MQIFEFGTKKRDWKEAKREDTGENDLTLKKNELTKTFCYTDGKAGINSKDTIRMFRIKTSTLM